ncbi:MAG: zinc ribbon domain-containing protein [Candidatus Nanopelagicales bacterium]|jgi:putative FmdB family regulatory protein|nr:zinc ribbon domain-containing protein [Candidatus Nanopelagicales bacterium]
MPTYEFRCRACGHTFTESRPMAESGAPATCPAGHADTVRLLDVAGVARRSSGAAPAPAPSGGGGGCCGGGCCS